MINKIKMGSKLHSSLMVVVEYTMCCSYDLEQEHNQSFSQCLSKLQTHLIWIRSKTSDITSSAWSWGHTQISLWEKPQKKRDWPIQQALLFLFLLRDSFVFVIMTYKSCPIKSLSDAGRGLLGYSCLCVCPVSLSGHLSGFWLARETPCPSQSALMDTYVSHGSYTPWIQSSQTHTSPTHDTHSQTSAQPLWRVENILDHFLPRQKRSDTP